MMKKRILSGILIPALFLAASCRSGTEKIVGNERAGVAPQQTATAASQQTASETPQQAVPDAPSLYQTGFQADQTPYTPIEITPSVPGYQLQPDLSNIVNLSDFPSLTPEQKEKIAQNGFVVVPSDREQLFYIYEANEYENLSGFVTVDSVLQVYHIFFDYALRTTEAEAFYPALQTLNLNMLDTLNREYKSVSDESVREEIVKAIGYFGVAALNLGDTLPPATPAQARELIYQEMELIKGQAEDLSPLLGVRIDYSQFIPRGHYTRSEELTNYFKAMMWYGLVPFRLYDEYKQKDISSTLCALVITNALFQTENGSTLWESIYSPTCFFVGDSDDITPFQYKAIMDTVYGRDVKTGDLGDLGKLDAFYKEADKLPKPQINAKRTEIDDTAEGLQFRFMGQRYIADSEILQELSEPILRPTPTGLDVFAVLGSSRAAELVTEYFEPTRSWPEYNQVFQKLRDKLTKLTDSIWQSNLYYGWLWTLKSLTGEYGEGYPLFMQNTAWQDKSLATTLGSWAELRHDTILYGKQSGAEKGGPAPPSLPSYVEPAPEVYNKLLWLTRYTRDNLSSRSMLSEKLGQKMEYFEDTLEFLLNCSLKELRGETLSEDENRWILFYGGRLEHLSTSVTEGDIGYWYEIESDTDKNMAVIADVHTVFANALYPTAGYLEEAVGHAAEIYAAIPADGQVYLARGAVFDYYEFLSDKRLTDEEWQNMLKSGNAPDRPQWVGSFMSPNYTE